MNWNDCDFEKDNANDGPYGPATFFNTTYDGTIIYGLIPKGKGPFPLMGFMHGSTGQYEMYDENLEHFASHGFLIVFPHIKSPEKDKKPLTTDTKGKYLMKAIDWAIA